MQRLLVQLRGLDVFFPSYKSVIVYNKVGMSKYFFVLFPDSSVVGIPVVFSFCLCSALHLMVFPRLNNGTGTLWSSL